jgi:hypothetical protein
MTHKLPDFLKEIATDFRWTTREGKQLRIEEMETSHIFNCVKMLFNHVAEAWGGHPVWYTKRYTDYAFRARQVPDHLMLQLCLFVWHIEQRGDLPEQYRLPYQRMIVQLRKTKELGPSVLAITSD